MAEENFLDLVPVPCEHIQYETDSDGIVTLFIEHSGFFDRCAQKLFKKAPVSTIRLDEIGSFLWPLIDGKHSVYDLALLEKEAFGEKAEPLYPRIIKYFQIMRGNNLIQFKKQQFKKN